MSLFKYFSEGGGQLHGDDTKLLWPGSDSGFPVKMDRRQAVPLTKTREYEQGFEHAGDFKHRVFRLWIPEDAREYDKIMDRIANKWFAQIVKKQRWNLTHENMIVYLEWVQIYAMLPNQGAGDVVSVQ